VSDLDWPRPADVGSGIVADLCAKIDLHVGSVERLSKTLERQRRTPPAQPVFGRTAAAGVFATGAALILTFPLKGPDLGHFWYVRSIAIGGLSPTVAAAGRADVYVSAANAGVLTLASFGLGDWRDQTLGLPNVAFYGRGELPLRLNEEIVVVVSNGTNAQQYVATVQFEDYAEAASRQAWDL
jgi:hypothetical protein